MKTNSENEITTLSAEIKAALIEVSAAARATARGQLKSLQRVREELNVSKESHAKELEEFKASGGEVGELLFKCTGIL